MSAAAEQYVRTCPHPKVKGATRALLEAIAQLVPEGQTTTPLIALPDLAARARCVDRTARTCRDDLIGSGLIKVHDGGRGKVARYELLELTEGARPLSAAPLPLVGRAKPPRTKIQRSTSAISADLFDATSAISADVPDVRAYDIGNFCRRWWANVGNFCRRWWPRTKEERSTSAIFADVALPRSRSRSEELVVEDTRAREADEFLTWWAQTFPTFHDGTPGTVSRDRDGPIVRELLAQGRTLAHLQAMAIALWEVTTDGVAHSDRWWIAERVTVRRIAVLRHKRDFLDREVARRVAPVAAPALDNVWVQVLQRIEPKMNRHSFHTWFVETTLVEDRGAVIEVAKPGANSSLTADWIRKHFADVVQAAITEVRPGARVEFVAVDEQRRKFG